MINDVIKANKNSKKKDTKDTIDKPSTKTILVSILTAIRETVILILSTIMTIISAIFAAILLRDIFKR